MHTCVDLMAIMYNQEETNRLDGRAYIYRSLSASELFAFRFWRERTSLETDLHHDGLHSTEHEETAF